MILCITDTEGEGEIWPSVTEDRVQCLVAVITAMNLHAPWEARVF